MIITLRNKNDDDNEWCFPVPHEAKLQCTKPIRELCLTRKDLRARHGIRPLLNGFFPWEQFFFRRLFYRATAFFRSTPQKGILTEGTGS